MSLKEQVIGLNQLLTQLYRCDTRLSSILIRHGFSPNQISELQSLHLEPTVLAITDYLCHRVVAYSDGERRKTILQRRFALDGNPSETLEQLAKRFNLSRERIRQLEEKALRACRRSRGLVELEDLLLLQTTALVGQPEYEATPPDPTLLRLPSNALYSPTAIQHKPSVDSVGKSYNVDELRKLYSNAYAPWSQADDELLRDLYLRGETMLILIQTFGRKKGAITSRLRKLGLR